ncbi:hypothetical protein P7K49_000816 [Saguinus oedipus]|uniref:Bcl-2 Bcl-2 homology region 1-3 domain-containing protein n=1 Tax=Saguinus oedipus TaxID=9490 RepID=A0ABQ9WDB2_SAGOE|nr:hypothetical protein P7K49_000816 [Saguinus oedipus]
MADPLRRAPSGWWRTTWSAGPGSPAPEPPPSTAEAAVLRTMAAGVRKQYWSLFSAYLGYPGNRVELVARMAEALHSDSPGPTWGNVVMLLAFAETLLERGPLVTARWKKWGFQSRLKEPEGAVARDCQRLVALMSPRLVGQHGAWLEAQGGWDGFCYFFRTSYSLALWRKLLVQVFLSWLSTAAFIYFWTR